LAAIIARGFVDPIVPVKDLAKRNTETL
jgi:hypothetical protein